MLRAGEWRSAWAWRCPQRRAKRSLGGLGQLGSAIGVGGEEGHDGASILAAVPKSGVIAGGAQAAAGIATGGNGALPSEPAPAAIDRWARVSSAALVS